MTPGRAPKRSEGVQSAAVDTHTDATARGRLTVRVHRTVPWSSVHSGVTLVSRALAPLRVGTLCQLLCRHPSTGTLVQAGTDARAHHYVLVTITMTAVSKPHWAPLDARRTRHCAGASVAQDLGGVSGVHRLSLARTLAVPETRTQSVSATPRPQRERDRVQARRHGRPTPRHICTSRGGQR